MPRLSNHAGLNEAGFTLVEGMIAMVVLSVGLLAIASMQTLALSGNMAANELSIATNLAAEMIERIRFNARNANDYNGIDTLGARTCPPTNQTMAWGDYCQWQARLARSGLANVRGLVTVVWPWGPANLDQRQVTVTVNWSSKQLFAIRGRNRFVTLTTVVTPE